MSWNYSNLKNILERVIATDWDLLKCELKYDDKMEEFINEIETAQHKFVSGSVKRDLS